MARPVVVAVWLGTIGAVAGVALVLAQLVGGAPDPDPGTVTADTNTPLDAIDENIGLIGRPMRSAWGGWTLTNQLSAHNVLILTVETGELQAARAIAQQLIERRENLYAEVLVYFHRPGEGEKPPARRIQWTPQGGYVETNLEEFY